MSSALIGLTKGAGFADRPTTRGPQCAAGFNLVTFTPCQATNDII